MIKFFKDLFFKNSNQQVLDMISFIPPKRKINRVFLHCSDSDNPKHDDVSVIRKWHVEDNGWADVGYHYFIKKDGTIQKGRDLELSPSAQKGNNAGTIAICVHGSEKENFTDEQMKAVNLLCFQINMKYDKKITFHGHCEVAARDCPVFDYKNILKLDETGKMQ